VDGQQRITTISLLVMAIRDSSSWDGVPDDGRIEAVLSYKPAAEKKRRLHLNDPDIDESYEQIWQGNLQKAEGEVKSAYSYYTSKLQELNHKEIDELLSRVVNNFRVVRTEVEDPALAYPIFQSQNARGKDVPQHILATSRVHGEAYKLENDSEADRVIKNWDKIYQDLREELGRPRFRPNNNTPVKRPMKHILAASGTETPTRIKSGVLYENFERVISKYEDIAEFVNWFEKEKNTYLKIASSSDDVSGGRLSNETVRYLQYLNCAPSHAEILSYITYKKFSKENILKELFHLASIFTMRFELADSDNRKQKEEIYSLASKLKDIEESSEFRKVLKSRIQKKTPSDEEIKVNLMEKGMGVGAWKFRTRLILVSIEESRKSSKSVNTDNIHIDHIAPRNTFENDNYFEWRKKHEEDGFSERCMRIGNLGLLTETEHGQLKEASFADKMKTYTNSDITLSREVAKIAHESGGWGDNAIDRRTEALAKELANYWSLA
jgi:hypothetical protein